MESRQLQLRRSAEFRGAGEREIEEEPPLKAWLRLI
jgi:hypothetical protein